MPDARFPFFPRLVLKQATWTMESNSYCFSCKQMRNKRSDSATYLALICPIKPVELCLFTRTTRYVLSFNQTNKFFICPYTTWPHGLLAPYKCFMMKMRQRPPWPQFPPDFFKIIACPRTPHFCFLRYCQMKALGLKFVRAWK